MNFNLSAPQSFNAKDRQSLWNRLVSSSARFDLLIVGGGITGAAIAREAALLGLKTLLVEKGDFASGTSSRSSKLVHGGVRYLEQFEFGLVHESTRERARLWQLAPELTHPIGFLFPAFEESRVPLWKLNIGLWIYDLLAAFRTPSLHKKYSARETIKEEPQLRSENLTGSIFYWDGATDDALLTLANILDARANNASILSRGELTAVHWNDKVPSGENDYHRAEIRDVLSGETAQVEARVVVSALGPWTDHFPGLQKFKKQKLLACTRGSHIVLPKSKLPSEHAIVMTHPQDGRVLFTIPWGDFTVVGTTDLYDEAPPEKVAINAEEVDYLLRAAEYYFPRCVLRREDIVSTWSGLRPLIAPPDEASASQVSREHHLEFMDPGLLIIAGGKLTTHREMAEQAVDAILEKTQHWNMPLEFSKNLHRHPTRRRPFPKMLFPRRDRKSSRLGVTEATEMSFEDVAGILRTQMVLSIEDFMVRRTPIFYKEANNGLDWLPRVRDIFQRELGWDDETWEKSLADYRDYVNTNVRIPLHRPKL